MKIFVCDRCTKTFNHKTNFQRHILRKNPCQFVNNNDISREELLEKYFPKKKEEEVEKKFVCKNCKKEYNCLSHLNRHSKNCKTNIELELNKIKNEIEDIKSTPQVINYNTQNIQTINVNAFGLENSIPVSEKFMKKVIKNPIKGIPDLIGYQHFNPNHPENHNVRLGNKNYMIDVFNGKYWEAKNKTEIIQNLIVGKKDLADEFFEDKVEYNEIKGTSKMTYQCFSDKIDKYVNAILNDLIDDPDIDKSDKKTYEHLYQQVEMLLINAHRLLKSSKMII